MKHMKIYMKINKNLSISICIDNSLKNTTLYNNLLNKFYTIKFIKNIKIEKNQLNNKCNNILL